MSAFTDELYKVKRGNVSLKVSANEASKYYDMGYDVYSISGELVKQAVPKDVPTLQKAFLDNQKRIAELEQEVMDLNEQLAAKSKRASSTKKAE